MKMTLSPRLRSVAAEWHSGMSSPLYAVSCGEQEHGVFLAAAEELDSCEDPPDLSAEDRDLANELYITLRDMGSVGRGFCDSNCMDSWDEEQGRHLFSSWDGSSSTCKYCNEALPGTY